MHVQVPLAQVRLPLPGAASKDALPVGGRLAGVIRPHGALSIAQYVVALVALFPRQRTLEPFMLVGGVAQHHIEHDAHAALAGRGDKLVKILHGAVPRIDGAIVRHVIAVVALRRGVERREPQIVDAKVCQIVELGSDAGQIAQAIAIAIAEALHVDLVHDAILVIRLSGHRIHFLVHVLVLMSSKPKQTDPA